MTQDKIKWLAINVMGWKDYDPDKTHEKVDVKSRMVYTWKDQWNPYESWEDCGMLIEKANKDHTPIQIDNVGNWCCLIEYADCEYYSESNESPTHAITEAIYKAYKG